MLSALAASLKRGSVKGGEFACLQARWKSGILVTGNDRFCPRVHLGPANLTDTFEHLEHLRLPAQLAGHLLSLCGGDGRCKRSKQRHNLEAGESLKGRAGILHHKNESVQKSRVALRRRCVFASAQSSLRIAVQVFE